MTPSTQPLRLHTVLTASRFGLRQVAEQAGISPAGLSQLALHGQWPKRRDQAELRQAVTRSLADLGVPADQLDHLFDPLPDAAQTAPSTTNKPSLLPPLRRAHRAGTRSNTRTTPNQEDTMLIAKQSLTTDARKHFKLFTGPFDDEVTQDAHLFANAEIRFVREMVWQAALNARMLALVGESGSGKTTILGDLKERIQRENKLLKIIAPSVVGMADKDTKGKPLKSSDILAAIVLDLDPKATVAQTSEARTRQVLQLLEEHRKAGWAHVLVLEEAHDSPSTTLNQFKRLHERMRVGRAPLLGILMVGHQELADKLQKNDVREVLQRTEIVELRPLGVKSGDLAAYMAHRVKAYCGRELGELFELDAIAALATRLQGDIYPLAINNLANRALNQAAELGAPVVTADVVRMA